MATREILALDTATPQILAPQTGDTYIANRAVEIAPQAGSKALTLTGGTVTTSTPVIDATQTWNAGAVTFTGIKFNVTDTASASGSLLLDLQVGGASRFSVDKDGFITGRSNNPWDGFGGQTGTAVTNFLYVSGLGMRVANNFGLELAVQNVAMLGPATRFGWSSTAGNLATLRGNFDLALARDAANTLAQRNGVNAQTFRIYNTFTDASNYERGKIQWDSNVLKIGTEKAGSGTARALELQTDGTTALTIGTNQNATFAQSLYIGNANYLGWLSRSLLNSPSDGVLTLVNNAVTDFNRLQFGGTTSSFPALKRNSTALETKLADDSAYAPHAMQYLDITDGVTAPGAATGRARIYVDTADGDLKIIFADGTIKTIVVDT